MIDMKKVLMIIVILDMLFYGVLAAIHFLTQGVIPITCFECHGSN